LAASGRSFVGDASVLHHLSTLLPSFGKYYAARFIKGASCQYYEYSDEVRENVQATGHIYAIPGAKRVDTWPSGDVIETSNPVSPSHAASTLSLNSSAPVSEWWFEQDVGHSYYRLDRRTANCTSALLYRSSTSGPPPQGFPAPQVPEGSSSYGNAAVSLFDGSQVLDASAFGFNCTMGIATAQFRYFTKHAPSVGATAATASPLVMTFSEAGYTRRRLHTSPVAVGTPPTTQRSMRVELHNVRTGDDATLGLSGKFNLNDYFLPLEPPCAAIGIQRTATCASTFKVDRQVDDVCGTERICTSRAFFDGSLEFTHPKCAYGNID